MQTDTPARPDLPFKPELATAAPKKDRKGALKWAAVGVAAIILWAGISASIDGRETSVTSPDPITVTEPITLDEPAEESSDLNMEIMRIVWAQQPASDQAAICDVYNTPPIGVTSQMVRIFDQGADLGYIEAKRVLSTLLAEEC